MPSGVWEDRKQLEDLGVSGRIIVEWILNKFDGKEWIGLIWLRVGTGGWLF